MTLTSDGPQILAVSVCRDQLGLDLDVLQLDGAADLLRRVGVDFESRLARSQKVEDCGLMVRSFRL